VADGGLRQFHLDGVHARLRPPVMAGGPAALEAAVEHAGIAFRAGADPATRLRSPGAQVVPPLVPMLKSGSVPSNRNGIRDRIEWQSYRMATP
jgi:hypothetical protein